jgi:hypothetical protein
MTLYIDGKAAARSNLTLAKDASLSNAADFTVGQGFTGELDFLRVCRGTLADAQTTIGELYTWEFDGPFLRDFTGRLPKDGQRDAGAIERQ